MSRSLRAGFTVRFRSQSYRTARRFLSSLFLEGRPQQRQRGSAEPEHRSDSSRPSQKPACVYSPEGWLERVAGFHAPESIYCNTRRRRRTYTLWCLFPRFCVVPSHIVQRYRRALLIDPAALPSRPRRSADSARVTMGYSLCVLGAPAFNLRKYCGIINEIRL